MRGVLVEVAQNVGELQRAAEMMRERHAVVALHAEHAHRQPPDRARDAVAVEIERGPVRRADVGDDVHLHAVDHGEEILALEIEVAHRLRETGKCCGGCAGVERIDVVAPGCSCARAAARAGRDRRRCRRPRGRTNRFRTSPRAAARGRIRIAAIERAAGGALRRPWDGACSLYAPRGFCDGGGERRPSRRDVPRKMPANARSRRQRALPDARARCSGSRCTSRRVSRCASVLITETSRPRRQSLIRTGKCVAFAQQRSVRPASLCRQASSAGVSLRRVERFDRRAASASASSGM